MWLPNALLYGVPYEVFWKLNPKRLEPFQLKREKELKEKAISLDNLAWNVGSYVVEAMAVFFGKGNPSYPTQPRSVDTANEAPPGEEMTDGARFAAFAAEHNRQIRQRNKQ